MSITILHRFTNTTRQIKNSKPAGLRDRIMAQLIDGILLGILTGLILAIISGGKLFSLWISPMVPLYFVQKTAGFTSDPASWWWGGYFITIRLPILADIQLLCPAPLHWLIYGIYYGYFHSQFGQTPGKMMKGLVMLTREGKRISAKKSLLRWLLYLVSALPLGLGFWWLAFREDNLTWHDHIAKTQVLQFVDPKNPV